MVSQPDRHGSTKSGRGGGLGSSLGLGGGGIAEAPRLLETGCWLSVAGDLLAAGALGSGDGWLDI